MLQLERWGWQAKVAQQQRTLVGVGQREKRRLGGQCEHVRVEPGGNQTLAAGNLR